MMKELKLPQEFTEADVEKLMLKLFPEYKFKLGFTFKPKFGKHKGSTLTQALLKKNTFNAFVIKLKSDSKNRKTLLREATWSGVLVIIFTILTGALPMVIVFIIMKVTVFRKRDKEFDEIVSEELNKNNR